MAFGVGSFYCCVVTVISWQVAIIREKKMVLIIVRVLMCLSLIGGIITCKFYSIKLYNCGGLIIIMGVAYNCVGLIIGVAYNFCVVDL